jgi:hypothetical protein
VLQHEQRQHELKGPVAEQSEIRRAVHMELATIGIGVELEVEPPGTFNHRRGHIHAGTGSEVFPEGLRQAAHAATEVERTSRWYPDAQGRQHRHQGPDLGTAGGEKLTDVPTPVELPVVRQHGPERVDLAERIPVSRQLLEFHSQLHLGNRSRGGQPKAITEMSRP